MPNLYRCENNNMIQKRGKENSSSKDLPKKKKLNFKCCKDNTICSLNEVEHFLRNFNSFTKYIKLYKLFK